MRISPSYATAWIARPSAIVCSALICCFLSSAIWAEAPNDSNSWSQWRGPARDGYVAGTSWPEALEGHLTLAWEKAHSPSYSGPILLGDSLFTTETVDKKSEKVTAYDVASGEEKWSTDWAGAMEVPFFASSNGSWIRSTPACDNDHLIVVGIRDVMVSLNPKTGDENWRVDFPKDMSTQMPSFGAVCSPIIDGGDIYVQTGGALVKLKLADGSITWKSLENSSGMMSGGAFSSPVIAEIAGKRQLVVATRTALCGVDMESGSVLWEEPIESFRGMNILTPLVVGDRVFTSAHSGRAQLFEITLSESGNWGVEEIWSQKSQAYMSSPLLIGDVIYMHLKNQRVSALSLTSGELFWTSKPFGKYWSMVTNGKQILALDESGELLLIQPNEKELEIVDRMKVADDSWAHLAVDGEKVIVRDLSAIKVFHWK